MTAAAKVSNLSCPYGCSSSAGRLAVTVALAELVYGTLSHSAAMEADGFHSLFDGASNVIGLVGMWCLSSGSLTARSRSWRRSHPRPSGVPPERPPCPRFSG